MFKIISEIALFASLVTSATAGSEFRYSADGSEMAGYKVEVVNAHGTVVFVHDLDGITAHEISRAETLGRMGYNVLVVDMFGTEVTADTASISRDYAESLFADRALIRSRLIAGVEASGGIGIGWGWALDATIIMGYCKGGQAVIDLAASGWGEAANVRGFISFDGFTVENVMSEISEPAAPMLIYQGAQDESLDLAELAHGIEYISSVGGNYRLAVLGNAPYGYGVSDAASYNATADLQSWRGVEDFLLAAIR